MAARTCSTASAARGSRRGQTILDVGAGPGFATADLADTVGPSGKVIALERSTNFLAALRGRDLPNVEVRAADVIDEDLGEGIADGAWTRWVLAFLSDPAHVVARHRPRASSPAGSRCSTNISTIRRGALVPPTADQHRYRDLRRSRAGATAAASPTPRSNFRASCAAAGLELVSVRPMVEIITADDPMWQWPASFVATNASRLHELRLLQRRRSGTVRDDARYGRAGNADDDPGGRRNDRDQALASRSIAAEVAPSISTILWRLAAPLAMTIELRGTSSALASSLITSIIGSTISGRGSNPDFQRAAAIGPFTPPAYTRAWRSAG